MKISDITLISSGVTLQEALVRKKMIFSKYFSDNQYSYFKFYKDKKIINNIKKFKIFINKPIDEINRLLKKNRINLQKQIKPRINSKKFGI